MTSSRCVILLRDRLIELHVRFALGAGEISIKIPLKFIHISYNQAERGGEEKQNFQPRAGEGGLYDIHLWELREVWVGENFVLISSFSIHKLFSPRIRQCFLAVISSSRFSTALHCRFRLAAGCRAMSKKSASREIYDIDEKLN